MANRDAPMGFQPRRHAGGGTVRASGKYKIESAYATNIFRGDAVVLTSGFLAVAAENSSVIVGVFAGCQYQDSQGNAVWSPYWPASTVTLNSAAAQAYVYDDPMIVYEVQVDTGSTYASATHDSNSYDIELDHAGSTVTGVSGMELDLGDTGTGQFKVLGLASRPGNAAGVNAVVEVILDVASLKA